MGKALIVIDLQMDYFPGGSYPLWNAEETLAHIEQAVELAKDKQIPVVHVQHVADASQGVAPFFNEGTDGVNIHPRILAAAPDAPVVIKAFADSFEATNLEDVLRKLEASELLICGMMTQNCVTHTAISRPAEKYDVTVLVDCCTTVDEMLHQIALHALSTRVALAPAKDTI